MQGKTSYNKAQGHNKNSNYVVFKNLFKKYQFQEISYDRGEDYYMPTVVLLSSTFMLHAVGTAI
jgi:hypothetical protein